MGKRQAKTGELVIASGSKPKLRRPRKHEWNRAKEEKFLTALTETCNVKLAAAAAGMSATSAYGRRKKLAAFRAAWAEALGAAYQRLELVMLERALNGIEKIVVRKDGSEERLREYPNQIALHLLKMHRDSAMEAMEQPAEGDVEELRQRLFDKLERVRKREEARDCGQ